MEDPPPSPTPLPPAETLLPEGFGRATRAAVDHASYEAFVLETTLILPLGMALLVGVTAFIGPYLIDKLGLQGDPAHRAFVERLFVFCGAWWPLVFSVAAALTGGTLWFVRQPRAREAFARGGALAPLVGKLILFGPIVVAVALLLLCAVQPLLRALGTAP